MLKHLSKGKLQICTLLLAITFIGSYLPTKHTVCRNHTIEQTPSIREEIEYLKLDKPKTFQKRKIDALCHGKYRELLKMNIEDNARKHYTDGSPPLHNLWFKINNVDICTSVHDLLYFVYVLSKFDHFEERKRIRRTWGNKTAMYGVTGRVAFVIGLPDNDNVQNKIEDENREFKDIIQVDVIDSYANLTIKGTMSNLWSTLFCNNAKYIIKTDDDILLNIFRLTTYLRESAIGLYRTFFCYVQNDEMVARDGKYKVTHNQLSAAKYPRFCHGPMWVVTPDLPEELFCGSFKVPYIGCEDVYTSGLVAEYIGRVKHVSVSEIDTLPAGLKKDFYTDRGRPMPIASVPDSEIYDWVWGETLVGLTARENASVNPDYLKYQRSYIIHHKEANVDGEENDN